MQDAEFYKVYIPLVRRNDDNEIETAKHDDLLLIGSSQKKENLANYEKAEGAYLAAFEYVELGNFIDEDKQIEDYTGQDKALFYPRLFIRLRKASIVNYKISIPKHSTSYTAGVLLAQLLPFTKPVWRIKRFSLQFLAHRFSWLNKDKYRKYLYLRVPWKGQERIIFVTGSTHPPKDSSTVNLCRKQGNHVIHRIEGIKEKVEQVCNAVSNNPLFDGINQTSFIFPKENQRELSSQLKNKCESLNIRLCPVSTIQEALSNLGASKTISIPPEKPKPSAFQECLDFLRLHKLAALLSMGVFTLGLMHAVLWMYINSKAFTISPEIIDVADYKHVDINNDGQPDAFYLPAFSRIHQDSTGESKHYPFFWLHQNESNNGLAAPAIQAGDNIRVKATLSSPAMQALANLPYIKLNTFLTDDAYVQDLWLYKKVDGKFGYHNFDAKLLSQLKLSNGQSSDFGDCTRLNVKMNVSKTGRVICSDFRLDPSYLKQIQGVNFNFDGKAVPVSFALLASRKPLPLSLINETIGGMMGQDVNTFQLPQLIQEAFQKHYGIDVTLLSQNFWVYRLQG